MSLFGRNLSCCHLVEQRRTRSFFSSSSSVPLRHTTAPVVLVHLYMFYFVQKKKCLFLQINFEVQSCRNLHVGYLLRKEQAAVLVICFILLRAIYIFI